MAKRTSFVKSPFCCRGVGPGGLSADPAGPTAGWRMAEADDEDDGSSAAAVAEAMSQANAAKELGNQALKSADMPLASENYEKALKECDAALSFVKQPKVLQMNDVVQYEPGRFATVDMAYPQFGDYVLKDVYTQDIVKQKVGRFDEVQKRFMRKELSIVPQELYELRQKILLNLTLVALKLARGTRRQEDYEETVVCADKALAMNAKCEKANMRKGVALFELHEYDKSVQALMVAAQETNGKDPTVIEFLQKAVVAKGKAKGKGKQRNLENRFDKTICASCGDPWCHDAECYPKRWYKENGHRYPKAKDFETYEEEDRSDDEYDMLRDPPPPPPPPAEARRFKARNFSSPIDDEPAGTEASASSVSPPARLGRGTASGDTAAASRGEEARYVAEEDEARYEDDEEYEEDEEEIEDRPGAAEEELQRLRDVSEHQRVASEGRSGSFAQQRSTQQRSYTVPIIIASMVALFVAGNAVMLLRGSPDVVPAEIEL